MSEKMIQEYELSQEMDRSIKRVQEKLALEEFPAYTLLEQFAYLLCIRMQNRRQQRFMRRNGFRQRAASILQERGENVFWENGSFAAGKGRDWKKPRSHR